MPGRRAASTFPIVSFSVAISSTRAAVNVRLRPEVRAQLERDAQRAKRSVTKEISIRLEKSYVRDEMYGGSQMAAMFRELAGVASVISRQEKSRGSFFDDFKLFVLVRNIWQTIIQSHMPRPDDELLAQVCQEWDALKAGSPQTPVQAAAREWLIHHTPPPPGLTLEHLLARQLERAIAKPAGTREPASDPSGQTPELAGAGDIAGTPKPPDLFGLSADAIPLIGTLAKALEGLLHLEGNAGAAFPGSAVWPIGSLAKVMEGLIPSQGSARAAAGEVSRLAGLLAEMTEGEAAGDTAVPPIEPDDGIAAARGE
jgi:hypothetical protein